MRRDASREALALQRGPARFAKPDSNSRSSTILGLKKSSARARHGREVRLSPICLFVSHASPEMSHPLRTADPDRVRHERPFQHGAYVSVEAV